MKYLLILLTLIGCGTFESKFQLHETVMARGCKGTVVGIRAITLSPTWYILDTLDCGRIKVMEKEITRL